MQNLGSWIQRLEVQALIWHLETVVRNISLDVLVCVGEETNKDYDVV
jgi:hypothetical protein